MRTISEQEVKDILSKHDKWLKDNSKGCRANLSSTDLSYANLRYANLSSTDLSYANLRSTDLRYANLRSTDLRSTDLSYANLLVFQFQRDTGYFTFDGALRIGCIFMPITEWVLGYKEIGKKNKYTNLQIKLYGEMIKSLADKFNKGVFNDKQV